MTPGSHVFVGSGSETMAGGSGGGNLCAHLRTCSAPRAALGQISPGTVGKVAGARAGGGEDGWGDGTKKVGGAEANKEGNLEAEEDAEELVILDREMKQLLNSLEQAAHWLS